MTNLFVILVHGWRWEAGACGAQAINVVIFDDLSQDLTFLHLCVTCSTRGGSALCITPTGLGALSIVTLMLSDC